MKYELPVFENEIELPKFSRVLSAIEQNGKLVAYALVKDEEVEFQTYTFHVIPTGAEVRLPVNSDFIDTVSLENGRLIFHVFVSY